MFDLCYGTVKNACKEVKVYIIVIVIAYAFEIDRKGF